MCARQCAEMCGTVAALTPSRQAASEKKKKKNFVVTTALHMSAKQTRRNSHISQPEGVVDAIAHSPRINIHIHIHTPSAPVQYTYPDEYVFVYECTSGARPSDICLFDV